MCKVSVLMSVYHENNEYLRKSIESILKQTFRDFEFIIYDDNTSAENKAILSEYADKDSRIRIIENEDNRGLTYNLACGVKISRGEYIARMDSDDISKEKRLEKQVRYMEQNIDVELLTTNVEFMGGKRHYLKCCFRMTNPNFLKVSLLFNNSMPHPTAIMRRSFLEENDINYNVNIKKSQDYDLWAHIAQKGKIAFLKEPLVYYRIHSGQISNDTSGEQHQYRNQTRMQQLIDLGIRLQSEEQDIYLNFCEGTLGRKVWKNRKILFGIYAKIRKTDNYSAFWLKYLFGKRVLRNFI